MTTLWRRLAGAAAAVTAMAAVAWPAQPAQATTPVQVDVAMVHFHDGMYIDSYMRVALPSPLRARGTCKMTLVKVTTTDLGGGAVGTTYQVVASYTDPCEYSSSPEWGDRREVWNLLYLYGSGQYTVKAEFMYGDLYGYDYHSFSTAA